MEKIVTVGGHEYRMKSTAANLLKYKAQFGRDLLEDIGMLQKAQIPTGKKDANGAALYAWDFSKVDLEVIYNMVWLLIKAADPNLPPPMEWLDTLDTFPLAEAAGAAVALYAESMGGTSKTG